MSPKRINRAALAVAGLAMSCLVASPVHARSASDCAAEADRASRSSSGAAGGIVRGGAGGAVLGAIVGGSRGARRGAAIGGVVGGASGAYRKDDIYRRVYDDCMRGR